MCGIVGILGPKGSRPAEPALLERMCAAIEHRGPDDRGTLINANVAIGMQRLSVIDGADHNDFDLTAGEQMVNEVVEFLNERIPPDDG